MSTNTEEKPFFESENLGFAEPTPECDLLHPEFRQPDGDAALTETQYFGFNCPDEGLHGLAYLWHHANLGVVSGGIWSWRGIQPDHLQSELFDYVVYASDACLAGDLHDYTLPNGYRAQTLEPLKQHRISYEDPTRENAVDVTYEAVMPAMVLGNGRHLEQAMRTSGTVTLRGQEYTVDGYTVRDRSWGELRAERLQPAVAPHDWMTGVFSDDFAFGCTATDTLDRDPDWKGLLDPQPGGALKLGWIHRSGTIARVVSVSKRTYRSATTLLPERVELHLVDDAGGTLNLRGTIIAASTFTPWLTHRTVISLVRWEHDGQIGHGDLQEGQRPDAIRAYGSNQNRGRNR
jgi:hypothetical protein